jgi:outer membrane lipoprotein-sorting protein
MRRFFTVLFVLGVAAASATVSRSDPAEPAARLVGLSVALPDPGNEFGQSLVVGPSAGTKLTFQVKRPDAVLLDLDKEASKLVAFTDDKGTALADDEWLWTFLHVDDKDRSKGTFEVRSKTAPASGANKLKLSAVVALRVGSDLKSGEVKNVAFVKGTEVLSPAMPFKIGACGKPEWGDAAMSVELESDRDFDKIASMEFVAADGRVIEASDLGTSSMTFGGKGTWTKTIGLKEKLTGATIRMRWYAKLESVPVKIDGEFGLGL